MKRAKIWLTVEGFKALLGLPDDVVIRAVGQNDDDHDVGRISVYVTGGKCPEVPEAQVAPVVDIEELR